MTTPVVPLHITDLPPEILSVIFQFGVDDEELSFPSTQPAAEAEISMGFATAVSQTCSYFRKTALGNPQLWTYLAIDGTYPMQDVVRRIDRSRPCPLDIRIDWSPQDGPVATSDQTTTLDTILPESFRWRSLCVNYQNEAAEHPIIMRLCNCSARNLEHLSLALHDVENAAPASVNNVTSPPQIFQTGTPKLQFLRLRGVAIQFCRPQLEHIVTLHLEQTRTLPLLYSTFRGIITSSPALTNLSVYGDIIPPTAWAGHHSLIHLPQLRSLRLYSESGAMYSGLLLGIDAPILESLTLKSVQEDDLDAIWSPVNRRNYSHLNYLHFSHFDLSVTAYTKMFHTFLDIKEYSAAHLTPSESTLLMALLPGMTREMGQSIVPWPRLESLCFSFDSEGSNAMLASVAASRKAIGYPISRFFLTAEQDVLQQRPWESDVSIVGASAEVHLFDVDRVWPLNGVHGGDKDDTMFLR